MAGKDFYTAGNELFVDEKFEQALQSYSKAIEAEPDNDQYFTCRAQVLTKLARYQDAAADAARAVQLNPRNPKALFRKGIAEYHLKNLSTAQSDFESGKTLDSTDVNFDLWIEKCTGELSKLPSNTGKELPEFVSPIPVMMNNQAVVDGQGDRLCDKKTITPVPPQIRHDWYQTETHVVISVMVKNVKKDDFHYDLQPLSLSCTITRADQEDVKLNFQLLHSVVPEQSQIKLLTSKIELKLKKTEGIQWPKLERPTDASPPVTAAPSHSADGTQVHKYPTSSHSQHDWDRMEAEIKAEEKDEKLEGDAALNKLFQQIYSDGSDEVRRAMNKSFMESGGTVLSTNWGEIGSKQVECKPPDGMEFKKWES